MSKLIDADKLYEAIQSMPCESFVGNRGDFELVESVKESCLEAIEIQKSKDGWIPCSERLPEESGAYLVTIGGKYTHGYMGTKIDLNIFHHKIKKWKTRNDFVVAWKPLPEAFEEADSK